MKTKFIKSFEERVAFYIFISAVVTGWAEVIGAFLIRTISGKLRYMGYRSAMLGPDGLNPYFRGGILVVIGILVFILTFYYLIRRYMKYVRMISNAMEDIASGNLDTEIPVLTEDEFGQIASCMTQMQ